MWQGSSARAFYCLGTQFLEAGGVFSTSKRGAAAWNRKTEKSEVQHHSLKSIRERGPTYIGQHRVLILAPSRDQLWWFRLESSFSSSWSRSVWHEVRGQMMPFASLGSAPLPWGWHHPSPSPPQTTRSVEKDLLFLNSTRGRHGMMPWDLNAFQPVGPCEGAADFCDFAPDYPRNIVPDPRFQATSTS